MRAARYGAFWQLAENFLFARFLRTTLIVAGRRSDSKNVSFDRAILFELSMLRLQFWSCHKQNFPSVPHSTVTEEIFTLSAHQRLPISAYLLKSTSVTFVTSV